jgi:hypothetical protein
MTIITLLVAAGLAPFAIYFALKRPTVFPLGLYVMLVPFDAILGASNNGGTLTRIVAIASALALLFHMITSRRVYAPPKSWISWAVLTLWVALTALWTIDSTRTALMLGMFVQLFFFFTVLNVYPFDRRDVRLLAAITALSGTVAAAYGLYMYFQHGVLLGRMSISNGSNEWLDPNHLAASLLLPLAFSIGALFETKSVRLRIAAAIAAVTMINGILLTGSRGGLVAFVLMLLVIAWRTRYRVQILGFFAATGVLSLLSPTVWQRFTDPTQGSGSGRLFIWNTATRALKEFWLTGSGFGSFQTVYDREILAIYQSTFQGWSRPAHNAVISAAVEIGLLGAAMLLYAWWRSWRDARGNVVIEAAIIALFVVSLFLDVILFKYLWLAFSFAAMAKNAADPHYLVGNKRCSGPANRGVFVTPLPSQRRRLAKRVPVKSRS